MDIRDAFDDREPDSCAFLIRIESAEEFEDFGLELLGDSWPVITDDELCLAVCGPAADTDLELLAFDVAVLDRIGDQILKDLVEVYGCAVDIGEVCVDGDLGVLQVSVEFEFADDSLNGFFRVDEFGIDGP